MQAEMNHLNNVLLEGILVDDPKRIPLAEQPESVSLVKFDVASDRFYVDRNGKKACETVFVPVQCWGSLGEKCLERLKKGMTCRTVGRLRLCRWIAADGSSRRAIEIVAHHIEFRKPRSGSSPAGTEILEERDNESDSAGEIEVMYEY